MAGLKMNIPDAEHGRGRAGPAPARKTSENDGAGARSIGRTLMWISTSPFVLLAAMYVSVLLGGNAVIGEGFFRLFVVGLLASPVAGILFLTGFGTYMSGVR